MNRRAYILAGICFVGLGFCLGAGTFYLITAPVQERMMATLHDCATENANLRRENSELKNAQETALTAGRMLLASRDEQQSQITVLYERAPQSPLAGVLQMLGGRKVAGVPDMVPRWIIPAKVVPIVTADAAPDVRVTYVDKNGSTSPAAPEVLPQ